MIRASALARGAFVLSLTVFLSGAGMRGQAMPRGQPASIVVENDPRLRLASDGVAEFDGGRINTLDTSTVEHVFTLRNSSAAPMTIAQLEPSCHCMSARIERLEKVETVPLSLRPNEEARARVAVQLDRQAAGDFCQTIFVRIAGEPMPAATLRVRGKIEGAIVASPSHLDFGRVAVGQRISKTVTLTFDARVAPREMLPDLAVQADPRVEADQVGRAPFD